jgi:hypothetical protein
MTYKQLKAFYGKELRKYPVLLEKKVTLSDLLWFCAFQTANELTDMSTKHIARWFFNNRLVFSFRTQKDVEDWLNDWGGTQKELKDLIASFIKPY